MIALSNAYRLKLLFRSKSLKLPHTRKKKKCKTQKNYYYWHSYHIVPACLSSSERVQEERASDSYRTAQAPAIPPAASSDFKLRLQILESQITNLNRLWREGRLSEQDFMDQMQAAQDSIQKLQMNARPSSFPEIRTDSAPLKNQEPLSEIDIQIQEREKEITNLNKLRHERRISEQEFTEKFTSARISLEKLHNIKEAKTQYDPARTDQELPRSSMDFKIKSLDRYILNLYKLRDERRISEQEFNEKVASGRASLKEMLERTLRP
jgi:DNA-binding Xre family transcriptional regulator